MDNSRQPPTVDVGKSEEGDLARQSSLLPGEVRTPTMVVTLSEAWGDVSGDWAAPGSSVWEEEAPSRHSVQTPLTGYGHEGDVWASATGSPLLGDDDDGIHGFGSTAQDPRQAQQQQQQAQQQYSSLHPDAAELAAAALQAIAPHGPALHADPQALHGAAPLLQQPQPQQHAQAPLQRVPLHQPRYASDVHYNYEGRFGTVHAAPSADPIRGMQGVVPLQQQHQQQQRMPPPHQQQPPQQSYFTVQEGDSRGRGGFTQPAATRNYAVPAMTADNAAGGVAPLFSGAGSGGVPYVPRLDDEEVAHSIIASAGLPLSMQSLVEYIHGGQPQALSHLPALGTTQNALRNYPNLNEPPSEEDAYNSAGSRPPQPSYRQPQQQQQQQQQQQGRWGASTAGAAANTGFAVRGSDYSASSQHTPSPPPTFSNSGNGGDVGGGFVVSAGGAPANPRVSPHAAFGSALNTHGGYAAASRHKSESEYLSDLLHFHANFFPPPPPPRVPKEERRNRAELWYHYASKWDITHRLPPPPRTPLPEMELEYRMRLQPMTRVPYHGDGWLQMGERWFDVTQTLFDFPEENVGDEVDFNIVLQQAVLS